MAKTRQRLDFSRPLWDFRPKQLFYFQIKIKFKLVARISITMFFLHRFVNYKIGICLSICSLARFDRLKFVNIQGILSVQSNLFTHHYKNTILAFGHMLRNISTLIKIHKVLYQKTKISVQNEKMHIKSEPKNIECFLEK